MMVRAAQVGFNRKDFEESWVDVTRDHDAWAPDNPRVPGVNGGVEEI